MSKKFQENNFNFILRDLPSAIMVCNLEGEIVYANNTFKELLGFDENDFNSIYDFLQWTSLHEGLYEEIRKKFQDFLGKVYSTGKKISKITTSIPCKNKEVKFVDMHLHLSEQYIVVSILDITEERDLNRQIAESEAKFRILFENSNDAIFLLEDFKITFFNRTALSLFECDIQYLVGKTPIELSPAIQPDGQPSEKKVVDIYKDALKGNVGIFEWQHIKASGETFDVEISLNAFNMSDKNVMQAIIRDTTERKKTYNELEKSKKQYKEIVENANSAIIKLDKDGVITFFNEFAERLFKFERESIIGQHWIGSILVANEDNGLLKDVTKEKFQYIIKNIVYFYYWECWNIDSFGNKIYMSWTNKPLVAEDGELVGVLSIGTDITKNKTIYEQLRENESKYRTIFNTVSDSIVILDTDGKLIEANEQVHLKLGLNINTLKGKDFSEALPPEYASDFKLAIKYVLENEYGVFEFEIMNKDGVKFPAEVRAQKIKYEGKDAIITINRDISQRKKEQKKIFNAIVDAEEQERTRVARELHDGVSPILSTAKLYAQTLKTCEEEIKETVFERIEVTIDEAIKTVSEISNNLSPHILQNFGLITAINSFSEKVQETNNIEIEIKSNFKDRLPEKIEITLYRVGVELINNSIKHAQASNISLNFIKDNVLFLQYNDNGKGFNFKKKIEESKGMGLYNMLNRVKSLDGNIFLDSKDEKGTKITISIPLTYEQQS